MARIGFVGLGIMGHAMAANLIAAGHEAVVWNRTASKADDLVASGGTAVGSPAEVAAQCDIVMVCVSDTDDVADVVFGDDGVAEGLRHGALIVDHS